MGKRQKIKKKLIELQKNLDQAVFILMEKELTQEHLLEDIDNQVTDVKVEFGV